MMIRRRRTVLWLALISFIIGLLVLASDHPGPDSMDLVVLHQMSEWRSSFLTIMFINITALGSLTLLVLHSMIACFLLMLVRDGRSSLQLVTSSAGSWILTQILKRFIERPRPTAIPALVEASGFSSPSGHAFTAAAMYVTIALIAARHLHQRRLRVFLAITAAVVIFAVAFSRVYLGVHYMTDVAGGALLGTGWALFLEGMFFRTAADTKP